MNTTRLIFVALALGGLATGAHAEDQRLHMTICGDDSWAGHITAKHIDEWEAANPGFNVDIEYIPWGQCQEKATTLASAGTPPALSYLGSRTLKRLALNDLIVPIELTDEEKATYAAPILRTVSWNDKVWGLPRAFSTQALYYNKDIFTAAGLDPESPPKTWDEMYAAAQTIVDKTDAYGFGLVAASFDNTMQQLLTLVYSNGGQVLDDAGKIVFDQPNTVEAFEFYKKLIGVAQPGPVAYNIEELSPLFVEGKLGMLISGPWERGGFSDVNFDVSVVPHGPNGTFSTLLITDSYAVFKGTGVEEQAESLARYLTSPDRQFEFEVEAGLVPLRNLPGVAALVEKDHTWSAFLDSVETGGPEPFVADYQLMQDAFSEAAQGIVLGEITPPEAVTEAAEKFEDAL